MTFAELKTKVAAHLDRTNLTDKVGDFINMAQKEIERDWNYNGMSASATGTLSADNIAFPTRYKDLESLFISFSSENKLLLKKKWEYMNSVFPYGATEVNTPKMCASKHSESKIYVRPYPDTSYSYVLNYYVYSAELAADADTNWLLDYNWDALLYGSLLQAGIYMAGDERIAIWNSKYMDIIRQIRHAEIKENLTGSYQTVSANMVV